MINKVIKIVKQASKIMLKQDFNVSVKDTVSNIVTSSDLQIQEFLYDKLTKMLPNSGFLGEEDVNLKNKEYTWIVDPIDGTTNFARGIDYSAISVALSKNNEIVLGVVYNPFRNDLFYATKNNGAYHNGKKISVSNSSFDAGLFCTAMSLYKKELAPICFDIISETYYKCNDIRRMGSCALELCYLAAGKCDLYFEIRVCPWDYAAASLILQEAGGILCTYPQKNLIFTEPVTLVGANNLQNYKQLEKIVKKHITKKLDLN